jgi:hypothetical protein
MYLILRTLITFLAIQLYLSAGIINAQSSTPLLHVNSATPFTDGFARVENGTDTWFIDTAGNHAFDQIFPLEGHTGAYSTFYRVLVQNKRSHKGQWGIIKNGQWILQPVYDSIDTRFTEWKLLQNGKRTWCDTTGKLLAPLRFSDMGYLDGNFFDVRQKGKWGIYDTRTDSLIIPVQYDGFDYCGGCGLASDYVLASKNGKWGVIGFDNKVRVPFEYEHEHFGMRSDEWVQSLQRKGKQVLINMNTGKIFAEPEYEFPENILWNGLVCLIKNKKYGLVTATGKPVTKFEYNYITWFDVRNRMINYACVEKNGKYGLIDTTGAIIIPITHNGLIGAYDDSTFFVNGEKEKLLLDRSGKKLLTGSYTDIVEITVDDNTPWLFSVSKNDKNGLYNRRSKMLTPPIYDDISASMLKGFLFTECDKKKGLLSLEGKEIFAPQYDFILHEFNDSSLLQLKTYLPEGAQESLATLDGKMLLLPEYSSIEELKDHMWLLQNDSSYFLFNSQTGKKDTLPFKTVSLTGEDVLLLVNDDKGARLFDPIAGRIIADGFENIYSFQDHKAIAKKQEKMGVIDAQGRTVVPFIYSQLSDFKNGLAVVQKDNERYGVIDSTGREIIPMEYDKPEGFLIASDFISEDNILLFKESPDLNYVLKGLAAKNGQVVAPPQYEIMWKDENGPRFLVRKNRKFGVLAADGQWIVPAIYDDIHANNINRYTGVVNLSFPLLCYDGKNWKYVTQSGKVLPVSADNIGQTDN